MIENRLIKKSVSIAAIGIVICLAIGLYQHTISYAFGFLIGYLISLIILKMTASRVDLILEQRDKSFSAIIIILEMLGKYIIYSAGICLGIFFKEYVNYIAVFIGYFVIKITIFADALQERRKKVG